MGLFWGEGLSLGCGEKDAIQVPARFCPRWPWHSCGTFPLGKANNTPVDFGTLVNACSSQPEGYNCQKVLLSKKRQRLPWAQKTCYGNLHLKSGISVYPITADCCGGREVNGWLKELQCSCGVGCMQTIQLRSELDLFCAKKRGGTACGA